MIRQIFALQELPMEELQQIGLADGRSLRLDHDDLDALLAGRRTDMLRLEDLVLDDMKIEQLDAKLSLERKEDGTVGLLLHPIRREPIAPEYLTRDEAEGLEKGDMVNLLKKIYDGEGHEREVLVEFDRDTNEFVVSDTENIEAPEEINGVPLTAEQKERFRKGKEVKVDEDGTTIQYAAQEKQGMRSDKLHLIASIVIDGGISYVLYKTMHALWGQKHDKEKDKPNGVGKKYNEAFQKFQQQQSHTNVRPVAEEVNEEIDNSISR
jgi:hypothetical protein